MKTSIVTPLMCIFIALSLTTFAQSPNAIPYQAVARNNKGNLLQNQAISLRFSIRSDSSAGAIVYQETQAVTTNAFGLFTVNIGKGVPAINTFSSINWGSAVKFTQVEIDTAAGTNFINMGTTQMLSVPYALYAAKSGTAGYTGGTGISIAGTAVTNTAPDRIVTLTGDGGTSVSGTYPNFTISSSNVGPVYSGGAGINVSGGVITNTSPNQVVNLTGNGATTVSGTYPNFTISSSDSNTTYSAGEGIAISGTTITNTSPNQVVNLTGSGATTVSGTYPNFTVSSPASYWAVSGNKLYNDTGVNIGIGTPTPSQKLDVNGTTKTTSLQMTNGADSGYIMQSDASGNATWVNPATFTGPLRYVGTSYLGFNSGAGGTGTSEGTGSNLNNIFVGSNAGYANTTGTDNVAIGNGALRSSDWESGAVAIGKDALNATTDEVADNYAIAIGYQALGDHQTPTGNVAIGYQSQYGAGFGEYNTSVGYQSLGNISSGILNAAFGYQALYHVVGSRNAAFGYQALANTYIAADNSALGFLAGSANISGTRNTFIGSSADATAPDLTNAIAIGYKAKVSTSNSMVLGNGVNVGIGTSSPVSKLEINGAVAFGLSKQTGSTTVTLDNTAAIWYFTGTAPVTLPTASTCTNRVYTIVNRAGSGRTISSYTDLSGNSITSMAANTSIQVISDGTGWLQIK